MAGKDLRLFISHIWSHPCNSFSHLPVTRRIKMKKKTFVFKRLDSEFSVLHYLVWSLIDLCLKTYQFSFSLLLNVAVIWFVWWELENAVKFGMKSLEEAKAQDNHIIRKVPLLVNLSKSYHAHVITFPADFQRLLSIRLIQSIDFGLKLWFLLSHNAHGKLLFISREQLNTQK